MTKATCDNATGVSVLLALARGWSRLELRRTVVVCAFAAEEFGCWGSRTYVAAHANETAVAIAWAAVGWLKSLTKLPMPSKDF